MLNVTEWMRGYAQGEDDPVACDVEVTFPFGALDETVPASGYVDWHGERHAVTGGDVVIRGDAIWFRLGFAGQTLVAEQRLGDLEAMSTVAVRIIDRDIGHAPVWPDGDAARGVLRVPVRDSVHAALSFHAPGATPTQEAQAISRFLRLCGDPLHDQYVRETNPKPTVLAVALAAAAMLLASVGIALVS